VRYFKATKNLEEVLAMKVKDLKNITTNITTEGGKAMTREEIKEILVKELGFVHLEENETIKTFGELIWQVYEYETYIRPVLSRKPFETFYTEGMEKVMEIRNTVFYTMEVWRIVKFHLYLVHIATGFDKYFRLETYDTDILEKIAQIELSEGFVYLGSQYGLEEVLAKVLKLLDPVEIRVY
jgi:hypothetical protein